MVTRKTYIVPNVLPRGTIGVADARRAGVAKDHPLQPYADAVAKETAPKKERKLAFRIIDGAIHMTPYEFSAEATQRFVKLRQFTLTHNTPVVHISGDNIDNLSFKFLDGASFSDAKSITQKELNNLGLSGGLSRKFTSGTDRVRILDGRGAAIGEFFATNDSSKPAFNSALEGIGFRVTGERITSGIRSDVTLNGASKLELPSANTSHIFPQPINSKPRLN